MRYKDREIWDKTPLAEPKITMSGEYNLIGSNFQTKWITTPVSRVITHSYHLHNLSELRELERFFMEHKGRLKSFFIPGYKKEMVAKKAAAKSSFITTPSANRAFFLYGQTRYLLINRNFATKIIDIKKNEIGEEIVILEDEIPYELDESSLIEELISVRFNSDLIEFVKSGAVGYRCELNFKEIFYEV
ncbi:MAG: hypothetical protein MR902_02410 [Campylobacter sp.]|nr:hypothetical protein [Campylobacter sp.]